MSRNTKPTPVTSDEDAVQSQEQIEHLAESLDQESARATPNGAADRELPIADFMEPVEYTWTEAGFEARQVLKRYCEESHADY